MREKCSIALCCLGCRPIAWSVGMGLVGLNMEDELLLTCVVWKTEKPCLLVGPTIDAGEKWKYPFPIIFQTGIVLAVLSRTDTDVIFIH